MLTLLLAATLAAAPKLDADGKLECEFLRMHHSFLERARDPNIGLVFLGDSITNGWQWGEHVQLWDRYFGPHDPANFGIGGDRIEHLLWRIENGELDRVRPRAVVLLIGTNNIDLPASEIRDGVITVVKRIREKLPDTPIVLMGIFPRGTEEMRAKVVAVNAGLQKLHDGKSVHFLDIGKNFLNEDGSLRKELLPDELHINYKGYQIWAEALTKILGGVTSRKSPRAGDSRP
jgi:lysophospholipase L1-like esterase